MIKVVSNCHAPNNRSPSFVYVPSGIAFNIPFFTSNFIDTGLSFVCENVYVSVAHFGFDMDSGGLHSHGKELASTNEEKFFVSGEPYTEKSGVSGSNVADSVPLEKEIL
jgi:hypothetical protein